VQHRRHGCLLVEPQSSDEADVDGLAAIPLILQVAADAIVFCAGGFGLLSAAFGVGAVTGALSIPHQLKLRSLNRVVNLGFILSAASMVLIATSDYTVLALAGAFGAGAAWVSVFASLSAATQSAAPAWVRARAVAMSMVGVMASIAFGSMIWGAVANALGTRIALAASAGVLLVLLIVNRRFRVKLGEEADVTPGMQLPDMAIAVEPRPDDGPVLIQLEYRIDREHRDDFLRAAYAVEPVRRRNGVSDWRIFRDLGEDGRFIERFVIMSWAEYVRLRTRMTVSDRRIADRVELGWTRANPSI
jgi:MFS family permease